MVAVELVLRRHIRTLISAIRSLVGSTSSVPLLALRLVRRKDSRSSGVLWVLTEIVARLLSIMEFFFPDGLIDDLELLVILNRMDATVLAIVLVHDQDSLFEILPKCLDLWSFSFGWLRLLILIHILRTGILGLICSNTLSALMGVHGL